MKHFPRRRLLQLAAGAVALPAVSPIVSAQTYPARPVRLIVGFTAGGAPDILARLLGQWLSDRLGQPFVARTGLGLAAISVPRPSSMRPLTGIRFYWPPLRTRSTRHSMKS
jgi:hypothetical protein